METLRRELELNEGIIEGTKMRRIIALFPYLANSFRQRKSYDEYYYDGGFIELSIGNIIELNASGFNVEISTYTISLQINWVFTSLCPITFCKQAQLLTLKMYYENKKNKR